jgi:hypothetical protein
MRAGLARVCGLGALALSGLALSGCERAKAPPSLVQKARFGIFYGGQIQEREQIPFEVDRARQIQGLRLDFSEPLPRPLRVTWEINRPGALRRKGGAGPERIVELGAAEARPGQTRFEQLVPFKPGDPLGTWNVRVVVDDQLVIDRRFLVYDAHERARARHDAGAGP